ncbi:MAG TPA: AI-2E family transporter [Stellaceae bacterium]
MEPHRRTIAQSLIVAAILITGLYFGRPVLEPLALAVLLGLMLAPAVRWLQRNRVGRIPAVFASVVLTVIAVFGLAAAVGDEVIGLARDLPKYENNIASKIRSLNGVPGAGIVGRATQVLQDLGKELAPLEGSGSFSGGTGEARQPVPVEIRSSAPALFQVLENVVGPLLLPLGFAGLVLMFAILILLKREDLRDRLLRLAGARDLHRTTAAMNEAAERLSNYLLMQLAVGVCFGVPVGVGLAVIGVPGAPLWGVLGVVLRFIPYLGGPMTAVVPAVLAIAVDPGWSMLLWTVLLFAAVEAVLANVVEPWIYGRTTGLSATAVIVASVFWTWLWGPVGLLLATPLTVCLVVLGRYVPQLQFLDILLGNQPVLSSQETLYQRLLAQDPEEATEQAEEFARDKSIDGFFDEVAIPALMLAQADSDRGALVAERRAIIAAGFAAVLDNLAEDGLIEAEDGDPAEPPIACLAGRNELDLAAAWLLQHILRRRGHRVVVFSPDAVSTFNIERLPVQGAAVVCLSLISTTATARARYLVRRIRRRARRAHLLIGFWGQSRADFSIEEAVVATAADAVVTTLAAAVAEIEAALAARNHTRALTDRPAEKRADQSAWAVRLHHSD